MVLVLLLLLLLLAKTEVKVIRRGEVVLVVCPRSARYFELFALPAPVASE